jgi:hypothetical protein
MATQNTPPSDLIRDLPVSAIEHPRIFTIYDLRFLIFGSVSDNQQSAIKNQQSLLDFPSCPSVGLEQLVEARDLPDIMPVQAMLHQLHDLQEFDPSG